MPPGAREESALNKTEVACRKIRAATTESQVVAAVRDYLASLGPPEALGIPLQVLSSCLVQTEESIHSAIQLFEDAIGAMREGGPDSNAAEGTRVVLSTAARRLAAINGKAK